MSNHPIQPDVETRRRAPAWLLIAVGCAVGVALAGVATVVVLVAVSLVVFLRPNDNRNRDAMAQAKPHDRPIEKVDPAKDQPAPKQPVEEPLFVKPPVEEFVEEPLLVKLAAKQPVEEPLLVKPPMKRFAAEVHVTAKGFWRVEGKELVQDTIRPNASIYFGDPKWTDYDFEVQAMRTKGNEQFNLLFRRPGPNREYICKLGAFGGAIHILALIDPPLFAQLHTVKAKDDPLQSGRWYTAKVQVRGDQGDCYLDGLKLFAFKADRHAAGAVGLQTEGAGYRFRNIKVTAPDGTVLLEGLPDLR